VVTVSIDQLTFLAPIRIGEMADLTAQVTAVFRTSMEIGVEVTSENPTSGERRKCCDAYLTFIALGPDRRPTEIPPLFAESEEERRRERFTTAGDPAPLAARRRASTARPPRSA
jgi:acyl-CoA hydrolase